MACVCISDRLSPGKCWNKEKKEGRGKGQEDLEKTGILQISPREELLQLAYL